MEIWLDTIDLKCIREGAHLGIISGVTTNPAILSQSDRPYELLFDLLSIQTGPVAVQVTATDAQGMIRQAHLLRMISERIVVKIPVNREGIFALKQLREESVPTMATAILHPKQALIALRVGATYIAPYLSHMADLVEDPFCSLQQMVEMFHHHSNPPKILVASIRELDQIVCCAQMGIEAVTLKGEMFDRLVQNDPFADSFTEKFNLKWQEKFPNSTFSEIFPHDHGLFLPM